MFKNHEEFTMWSQMLSPDWDVSTETCKTDAVTHNLFAQKVLWFAKKFDDISIVPTFILTPLTYLGGVFYSIKLLPDFWQTVSLANPILYMVNAFRYGFLGFSDIEITHALVLISVFITVLFSLAYYLLARGIGIRS